MRNDNDCDWCKECDCPVGQGTCNSCEDRQLVAAISPSGWKHLAEALEIGESYLGNESC